MGVSFSALCEHYGPKRLPWAENPSVGAGYAMATAALSATVLYVMLTGSYGFLTGGLGPQESLGGLLAFCGTVSVPFVVPAAFLVGGAIWTGLPNRTPFYGPVAGLLTTLLTYVVATVLFGLVVVGVPALLSGVPAETTGHIRVVELIGLAGFVFTGWLTLPVGAISGYIHEQSRDPTPE